MTRPIKSPMSRLINPKPVSLTPGKPIEMGKPASPGKSASAPGQMKRAAGVQSAKTFTKGFTKRKKS